MSAQVVCPHCDKSIKLRNRTLLGKKGKCPGCGNTFLLQEKQISIEPVAAQSFQLASDEPLVGTGARWVPDEVPVLPEVPTSQAVPQNAPAGVVPIAYVPVQTPQGLVLAPVLPGQAAMLPAGSPQPPYLSAPLAISGQQNLTPQGSLDDPFAFAMATGHESSAFSGTLPVSSTSGSQPATSTSSSHGRSTRRKRGLPSVWIGAGVAVIALGGVAFWLGNQSATGPSTSHQNTNLPLAVTGPGVAAMSPVGAYSQETLSADPTLVAEFRPTQGKPIPLNMLTGSNNIIIHLRPDRIWGAERAASELRASLTEDVVKWLETTIERITRRKPDQIDELLIGLSVVSKVEPPQVSTVFRLKKPEKRSALIQEFNGEEISPAGKPLVTRKDQYAFHIKDDRTIAICPAELGGELADSVTKPLDCVTEGISHLMQSTDRDRSLTVMFDVTDAITYSPQLFEPSVEPACLKVLEWFGPDAETVSWSLHIEKYLHSEMRVRPKGARSGTGKVSTPESLKQDLTARFDRSVELDLMSAVRQMRPARAGFRQMIGRYPAMVEAFRQSSIWQISQSSLTMTTVLPTKAATNLALGTVLTWDESTRTNFSAGSTDPEAVIAGQDLPKTVMERLKTEFEIEFSRKPLADAFAYLGEESKVTFVVDGDALKMAGYTKNMPQTFSLGKAPATKGIYTIITWPMQEKLCLVVDDSKLEAKITTLAEAEAKGLKVVPVESLK